MSTFSSPESPTTSAGKGEISPVEPETLKEFTGDIVLTSFSRYIPAESMVKSPAEVLVEILNKIAE